ncbi:MAG: hypothetical protein HIU93_15565 [Acidobacteria bacterium]|nr:hypothetical protein [Acidobacteriota bacterium]
MRNLFHHLDSGQISLEPSAPSQPRAAADSLVESRLTLCRFRSWLIAALACAAVIATGAPNSAAAQGSTYVPAVVGSSIATGTTGVAAASAVLDACGNVYEMESDYPNRGNVVEVPANGSAPVILAKGVGYSAAGLAIYSNATATTLYFTQGSNFYSSSASSMPIVNCVPQVGSISTTANTFNTVGNYYWSQALALGVDAAGNLFLGTGQYSGNSCDLLEYSAKGVASNLLTGTNSACATSLAVDAADNVYFTDGTSQVKELANGASAVTPFGKSLTSPTGVAIDSSGNLYIADSGNVFEVPTENGVLTPADTFLLTTGVSSLSGVTPEANGSLLLSTGNGITHANLGSLALTGAAVDRASAAGTATYVFNASETLTGILPVTDTVASKTFAMATGGTCAAGTSYNIGESCTVAVTAMSSYPGANIGALLLQTGNSQTLNTLALSATGTGAAITVDPGTLSSISTSLKTPQGAAIDSLGNLYVADKGSNSILLFAAGSTTGTAISTGSLTLNSPTAVAVDGAGNVFIADTGDNRVVEIPAGNAAGAVALSTSFSGPEGIAVDQGGNLYVSDTGNNHIVVVPNINGTLDAGMTTTLGTGLQGPGALTLDGSGNLYFVDSGNHDVDELAAPVGGIPQVKVITGIGLPLALATDASGSLYVVDQSTASVLRYGVVSGKFGSGQVVSTAIASPHGLAIDPLGNLYVTDDANALVSVLMRSQAQLPFGVWNVGTTSTPLVAAVSNIGNASVTFQSPSYVASGNTAAGFNITDDGCGTAGSVAAGDSCQLTSTFTPNNPELNVSETLTLSSNALNSGQTVVLSGTGAHITPATLTLALTSPSSSQGLTATTPVSFTATIGTGGNTAAPGGTIKFFVSGSQVGVEKVVNGSASITLPNGLPAGSAVDIGATYSGDQINYSGATANINLSVAALPTTLSFAITTPYTNPASVNDSSANAQGPSIPLTATLAVSGSVIPNGTVSFYSGNSANPTLLGTAPIVSGGGGTFAATLDTTALRAGTSNVVENNSFLTNYSLFAVYSGDSTYGASSSNSAPVAVVGPPLCAIASTPTCKTSTTGATFSVSPTTASVKVASTATGTGSGQAIVTINSYGGWAGIVSFTCSNLPAYATCAPFPGTASVVASTISAPAAPAQVQFIIKTNVPPPSNPLAGTTWWMGLLSGLLLWLVRARIKARGALGRIALCCMVLVLPMLLGSLSGCGSGTTATTTPTGTSDITVQMNAAQYVPGSNPNLNTEAPDTNVGTFHVMLTVE